MEDLPGCLPGTAGRAAGHCEYNPSLMTIRVLRPEVAAKIAAGEVIERPASVVKELIENSLDAGARRIAVDVTNGGTESMRVLDDGCGIPRGQVELAFRRFATSKVADLEDLEGISSLGFRGEALASIAAVARVSMVTKVRREEAATEIEVAEGEIIRIMPAASADGTSITVRGLFDSFPARRKFLASDSAEASRVRTLIQRYALAYPAVAFHLTVDGRRTVTTSGSGALLDAVAEVYTADLASEMIPVSGGLPGAVSVSGLAGSPASGRSNRSHVNLFVNGRWVQPGALGHAVEQAYHGFMGERRHPVVILRVQVDPEDVDANVHPAKVEVRFRRQREVYSHVQRAVREALTRQAPIPAMDGSGGKAPETRERTGSMWTSNLAGRSGSGDRAERSFGASMEDTAGPEPMKSVLPAMRVLGQSQLTYVVAEGPDGIYLFDQHAAHERVLYEKINSEIGHAVSRPLLAPEQIELAQLEPELADNLASDLDVLSELGFQIDAFGPSAYRLRAVPAAMGAADPVGGLVEALKVLGQSPDRAARRERMARSVACHGAVKAGMKMAREEMDELIRRLERCSDPHSCPHGRPTTLHLSQARLGREFGRI